MAHGREVRLKAAYAARYPDVVADVWLPAAEVAPALVGQAVAARRLSLTWRTLDPRHFEFRGGAPAKRLPRTRTRATDPVHHETAKLH